MKTKFVKRIITVTVAALVAVCLTGCFGQPESDPVPDDIEVDISDEMFTENENDVTLYVFQLDGRVYTADEYVYEVEAYIDDSLEDGGFYKLTADVAFLNGGVAGYVNYPQVHDVKDFEEISPFDIDLPDITETVYGVTLIGDYADGDVLVNEYDKIAVLKDGEWIYKYDKCLKLEDGTVVCCLDGVTEEEMEEGIGSGVILCEDYFALPDPQAS